VISVIIPTYNSGKFISEAIQSVLRQTCTDYEIIVIDDGSTDNTSGIIEKNFPQVRYFYIPNQGVSRARNYGIGRACGEFIAFLDADDLWLPEKLEKQLKVFNADHELMLVFTEHRVFDTTGIREETFLKKERLMKGDVVRNIFFYSHVALPTVMVRKHVFQEIGCFEENLKAAEDDNLWMRIALKFRIHLLDEVLIHCRCTENSLSRSPSNLLAGVLKNLELIENKYPDLRKHLGRANIRRKKSDIYSTYGYYLFSGGDYTMARRYFLRSIAFYPKISSLIYCFSSLFPPSIIEKVRNMKRKYKFLSFLKSSKRLGASK
jgi:glycosyltransferase involved in cell wall biosynthesis